MRFKLLAAIGVVIVALSLVYASGGLVARLLDGSVVSTAAGPCRHPQMEVRIPRRTMTNNDSEALTVSLSNPQECEVEVTIVAPNFQVNPTEQPRRIALTPGAVSELSWVLVPREMGMHAIVVRAGLVEQSVGIVVTNTLGLTAGQAQILSYIGMFFGPALTFPWLYERWRSRREENKKEKPKKPRKK